MENRAPLTASLLIVAGMVGVSAWAWPYISDHMAIAVHWNANGVPDGFAHKSMALFIMPALGLIVTAVFVALPNLTTRRANLIRSATAYHVGWVGVLLVLAVSHAIIVMTARGVHLNVRGDITLIGALVLTAIGNFLGKTAINPYVGVRTPWTRKSDYSWEKSNRLGGRLLVATGLATLGTLAAGTALQAHHVFLGGIVLTAAASITASYFYWRADPEREN